VRRALRELDPELPLSDVATTDELLDRALQRPRWLALLVGAVGAVALLLSVVGIYGVMAHYVQQHARDIGIRLALGGRPGQVLGLVVGQGLGVVTSGIAVGLLAALGLARSLSSLLFGVGTMDALAYLVVGALLLAAALVASFVPARRAISLPPAVVLRDD
jgi:ABC-type antimicrobial peptide transport system permease subunit